MPQPQPEHLTKILGQTEVYRKIADLPTALGHLLAGRPTETVPLKPGRDTQVVPIRALPAKKGLSSKEGQARLLHDLASIELQAMELGLRTLIEFPDAPKAFREELAEVTADEGDHLKLCLEALEKLDAPWGTYPVHIGLWESVASSDSLLDRIAIVHRYLEGSGLDASDTILRRLAGIHGNAAQGAVEVIRRDEMGHVQFGSRWYHKLAKEQNLDPSEDFAKRILQLFHRIPRRLEPVVPSTRLEAGFTEVEIAALQKIREQWISGGDSETKIHTTKQV